MELEELAQEIAALPTNDIQVVAERTFEIVVTNNPEEVHQQWYLALLEVGIDVSGICKKKRPQ